MTPYEQAAAVYTREACVRTFEEDLHLHLLCGYVISRPDFFIMGRAVCSKADPVRIINPAWPFDPFAVDCWHVYLFAGNIAPAFAIMPRPLPLVSFERKNELRFYPLEAIRRLSGQQLSEAYRP